MDNDKEIVVSDNRFSMSWLIGRITLSCLKSYKKDYAQDVSFLTTLEWLLYSNYSYTFDKVRWAQITKVDNLCNLLVKISCR